MKRFISVIIAVLFISINVEAQKTYALLTGISNYGTQDSNLYNTTKDVKALKKVFDKQGATVAVLTSSNVTKEGIEEKLGLIAKLAKPEDKVIFFFSGHGNVGGLITYGTSTPMFYNFMDLMQQLSKIRAREIFVFVDACKSGSVAELYENGWAKDNNIHPGINFFMSSRANELSAENNWIGHGYFTQALLKGLRGLSDTNSNRQVTVEELFNYINTDVTARTKGGNREQHPVLIGPKTQRQAVVIAW